MIIKKVSLLKFKSWNICSTDVLRESLIESSGYVLIRAGHLKSESLNDTWSII